MNLARQIEYGPAIARKVQPLLFVSGTQNTIADNEVIAAPGAKRQIVLAVIILQNETDTAQTSILLKSGGTAFLRVNAPYNGDGIAFRDFEWPMGENRAVQLRPAAAAVVGYTLGYYIQDVV